ncbi:hypothetical protein EYF80_042405 [Liparis tanakae]|uniref:Uncharacterized protein n=1 Tax=Liparis tanakae TaxID=230148 RepID=A0A4Z2G4B9_9TELE|nr:hypothetical protein EYF80_042405 [Liparis tanakae]
MRLNPSYGPSAERCSEASEAGEGLEASRQAMERLLLGAGAQLEDEEHLMGISCRLQTALEKMLMAISDSSNQEVRESSVRELVDIKGDAERGNAPLRGDEPPAVGIGNAAKALGPRSDFHPPPRRILVGPPVGP